MPQHPAQRARIPIHAWICLAVILAAAALVYCGTRLALPYLPQHILTGPLDARIPFSPPWVIVYLLCFPFWVVSALWILSGARSPAWRITGSFVLAALLTGIVFLVWPGTLQRPEVTGGGFFNWVVRIVYAVDSPTNLCPSMHVLFSYFCFRGAAQSRTVPRWYALFSFCYLLLVCCSVLLVKQHAFIDVPAGVAVAELSLQCGRLFRLERLFLPIEKKLPEE